MAAIDNTERSMSFSRGKGLLKHTDRTYTAPNVDPERTEKNIVLVNQSLSKAYDEIFGESQAAYNAKQKRKDRKIDDYFRKLFGVSADDETASAVLINPNKQQSFYEWVLGIGGAYDTAIVDWVNDSGKTIKANPQAAMLAAECLKEYITGNVEAGVLSYKERNPKFHLMKAIIHMDEKTPHIHIDAIPFSDGYKTGMTRQQGIARALKEMGYGVGDSAISLWQESERKVFREICERHGFKIRDEEKSRGFTVLTRQYGEYHENELKLESQRIEIAEEIAHLKKVQEQQRREQETVAALKEEKDIEQAQLKEAQDTVDELDRKVIELDGKLTDKKNELHGVEQDTAAAIARQKETKRAAAAEADETKTALATLQAELTATQERINALDKQEKEQAKRVNGVDSSNIEIEQIKADIKPSKIQRDKSVISTDKLNSLIELAEQGQAAIAANAQTQKKMKNMVSVEQYRSATNTLLEKNTALKDENNALKAEVKEKQGVIEKIQAQFEKFKAAALKLDLFDKIMELIKRTEKEPEQENKKSSPKKQIGR